MYDHHYDHHTDVPPRNPSRHRAVQMTHLQDTRVAWRPGMQADHTARHSGTRSFKFDPPFREVIM